MAVAAGDTVAHVETAIAARFRHHARAGIAERNGLVELGLHLFERREKAFRLHLADDLLHLVGHLERLAHQTFFREFGEHAFRARAHETRAGLHHRALALAQRRRHIGKPHLACLERLEYLFHRNLALKS